MNYENCPICESKLIEELRYDRKYCKNGCYTIIKDYHKVKEYIFTRGPYEFSMEDHSDTWAYTEKALKERIAYWKENDRYLMRIMTEG